MRTSLSILLALAALPAASPAIAKEKDDTIIVTARSLKDTERALRECLQRNCPPDEDVKATLAHAENQFVTGDYKAARTTLLKSVGRNSDEAKAYPVPVSDLYRANARMAAHLGEGESYRLSTLNSRDALKAGLKADDWRILGSTLEVGDMRARLGYPREALRIYDDVAEQAGKQGWPSIVFAAQLRSALLLLQSDVTGEAEAGRKRLAELAETPGENAAGLRLAAKVLLARSSRKKGDESATNALIEDYAKLGGATRATLLYAEPIKQPEAGKPKTGTRSVTTMLATQNFEDRWVDIGFWVKPDGRVDDIEILRSRGRDLFWTKAVIDSIKTRVYAPLAAEPGDPGLYQVERYSLTSNWEDRTGTRLRERSATQRIERLDLTATPPESAEKAPAS